MTIGARILRGSAVLLLGATLLSGCVYQPTPGYGYYAPAPATVVVGGGWGCCRYWGGGGWRWR